MRKEKEFKIRTHIARQQLAIQKRRELEMANFKKSVFMMKRWDYIKDRRDEYEDFLRKKLAE